MLCAKGSPQPLGEGALGQLLKQLTTSGHVLIKADLSALQWPLCLENLTWFPQKGFDSSSSVPPYVFHAILSVVLSAVRLSLQLANGEGAAQSS